MAQRIPKTVDDLYTTTTSNAQQIPAYQNGEFKQMVDLVGLGVAIEIGDTYPASPTLNQLFINTTLTA